MKFSVCLDALYPGMPTEEAVRRAAAAGAAAIEFWGWWDKDIEVVGAACAREGVAVTGLCTRPGSLVDGVSLPKYLDGLRETIAVAKSLGCPTIITQVGNDEPSLAFGEQKQNLIDGLRGAAKALDGTGLTLAFEPLNTRVDHKGYYLWSSDVAAEVAEAVNSPRVRMLFDIYHQQIMEGDILTRMEAYLPRIGHVHCAGVPGRGPLSSGELHYPNIFARLDAMGYAGYAALELHTDDPDAEIRLWCGKQE